jgi:1,4-alpha-glucan branching enzyme
MATRAGWLVCAAAVWLSSGCASTLAATAPVGTPAGVRFTFVHTSATAVTVAGTFNQWSVASHTMTRKGAGGLWTLVVPLAPGEHAFMFVVDGREWMTPPAADDYRDDGFGARNGVVVVRSQ